MIKQLTRTKTLWRSSLLFRSLIGTLSCIAGSLLLVTLVFLVSARSEFQRQLRLRAGSISDFAATQSQFAMLVGDRAGLERIAQSVLAGEDVLFVRLSDASGRLVVTARRAGVPGIPEAAASRISTARGVTGVMDLVRTIDPPASSGLFDWETKKQAAPALGAVRIGFSIEGQDTAFRRAAWGSLGIAFLTLLLVMAGYLVLLRRMLQPLTALSEFARDLGEGDLARRAPVYGADELARVAGAFNRMAEKLGATMVSKSYVDDIIRSMGESLIVVDTEHKIRTVNEATCALLGYQEPELLGLPADEIVIGTGHEREYRSKQGARIPVLFSAAPLHAADGEVWVAQDITENKRVQEQLIAAKVAAEEASRAKGLFLASMSHELRTPLNAIIGYGELAEEIAEERGMPDMREDLRRIQTSGRNLLALLNAVLDASKLEAGRMELHPTRFALSDVIADIMHTIHPLAVQNQNEVEVVTPEQDENMFTDQMKFRQSLLNLVSNACKFTKAGKISVAVSGEADKNPHRVRIEVRDTGIGITPEQMPRLFQSFSQVDPSHARKYGGTGLGLAISKRLCELMGGTISVASVPGQGSVFTMTVPTRLEDGDQNKRTHA